MKYLNALADIFQKKANNRQINDETRRQWAIIAAKAQANYAHANGQISREKLKSVLLMFDELQKSRKDKNKDEDYMSNFPSSGRIEGTWDEVNENLEIRFRRALSYIDDNKREITSNYGDFYSRNLVNILKDKDVNWNNDLISRLEQYRTQIEDLANGNLN